MVNKRFFQLDDKEWLIKERQNKSKKEISEELGCHSYSITWAERSIPLVIRKTFKNIRQRNRIK